MARAKRLLAHKNTKKEPITPEHLLLLVQRFGPIEASLADLRALTICLLGFAAFVRYDKLFKLRLCDITIHGNQLWLFIKLSKMDQLRQGACVVIAHANSDLCPIAMLERYMSMTHITRDSSDSFLFRGIVNTKNGTTLREKGGLSYTTVCKALLEKLGAIGLDK